MQPGLSRGPLHSHRPPENAYGYADATTISSSFVLGLLVCEAFPRPAWSVSHAPSLDLVDLHGELSELMTDHVLGDADIVIYLAIVDLEYEPNKVWKNRGASRLSLDGRHSLTRLRTHDWQA